MGLLRSVRGIAVRGWHSETLMTWSSFMAQSIGFFLLLPLVLRYLSAGEFTAFQVFQVSASSVLILFCGVEPNLVRMLASVMGGARSVDVKWTGATAETGGPVDASLLRRLLSTIHTVYLTMTVVVLGLCLVLGSFYVTRALNQLENPASGWMAWYATVAGVAVAVYGGCYNCYLQGMGQVALARRLEGATLLASVLSSAIAVGCGGRLLAMIATQQIVFAAGILLRVSLTRRLVLERWGGARVLAARQTDRSILRAVISSSWKVGLGTFLHDGLLRLAILVYVRPLSAAESAPFLLTTKIVTTLAEMSRAPLYSKLPRLSMLMASGRRAEVVRIARRGMGLSYGSYVIGCVVVGLIGGPLLAWIGSQTTMATSGLWVLFAWSFFVERYSRMHLSLYTISNDIVWHWVYLASASLFVALMWLLPGHYGPAAYPLAIVASELLCNVWHLPHRSRRFLRVGFLEFERLALLPALGSMLLWSVAVLWWWTGH